MSKWMDDFVAQYGETGTVKRLTKEINDASSKKRSEDAVDRTLTEVVQGKYKRKGGRK